MLNWAEKASEQYIFEIDIDYRWSDWKTHNAAEASLQQKYVLINKKICFNYSEKLKQ